MARNDLFPTFDPEDLPLQDGPEPPANEAIGHPGELPVVADMVGAPDPAGLLVGQQDLQVLGAWLGQGVPVVVGGTVPVEPPMPVVPGGPFATVSSLMCPTAARHQSLLCPRFPS